MKKFERKSCYNLRHSKNLVKKMPSISYHKVENKTMEIVLT